MSILNQKKKIFGNIAAYRTLTEGLPKLKTNSSFPSINNNGDSITFLSDLIKSLVGYEALQQIVIDTLVYSIEDIEKEIKKNLKLELKSIVSCGINPSLPDFIKSTGDGMVLTVNKIDFTNMLQVDPHSEVGKMLYNDLTTNLINSTDFNTFLYQTIQNDGSIEAWGHTTTPSDILTFQFESVDVSAINPNNSLTVKAYQDYDDKKLTDLNNDYVDSISLFNAENLVTNVIDMVFGTVSNFSNKSVTQLEQEAKINSVLDKIIKSDENDAISDKYFTFTNKEINEQQIDATYRKNGQKMLDTSKNFSTSVSFSTLKDVNSNIKGATNQVDKKSIISSSLNTIGNQVASFSTNPVDTQAIKLNFIQEIVNNLTKVIVNSILSPKVIMIFMINYKIVYGDNADYTDAIDFMKKNKNLIHSVTKNIAGTIIKVLLKVAMKKIAELVAAGIAKQIIDKNQSNLTQLLSLIGVPSDTLRKIKGLL